MTGVERHGEKQDELRRRVWLFVDPDGVVERLAGSVLTAKQQAAVRDATDLVETVVRAVWELSPKGWAFSGRVAPVPTYRRAVELLDAGSDFDEVERCLVAGWTPGFLRMLHWSVRQLGGEDPELAAVMGARARLVEKARMHHEAGRYEAVLPLLFAQVDGLTADATGKYFFASRDPTPVIDEETIAGLDESLVRVRRWFDKSRQSSGSQGAGSRHGVVHGRELAYDTEVNAVRAWALLAAVVDLTGPIYERRIAERRADHVSKWSGSDGVDEHGRRLDDRGFLEARELLEAIDLAQFQTAGHYTTVPQVRESIDASAATVRVADDRRSWWAYTTTPSGWVIGLAGADTDLWVYDGPEPPSGGHADDPRWVAESIDPLPPNWIRPSERYATEPLP